ncbi:hypothetical protein C8R45DRAFT_272767 [Mycena sanguinolenta]|nr:hypothetical protein C8R45DRAFT_272767 [Mycena sanguinolenta]
MQQYNFAWTTLQFSASKSFNIPGTSPDTMWAGSKDWRSGSHFMGESNGYIYEVSTWKTPGVVQAKLCLYQLPSLRTGGTDLKKLEFNINLRTDSLKAVTVDPVAKVVALLELSALHVYNFQGRYFGLVPLLALFNPSAEIYHMELHGEMACIVSHYPSPNSLIGMASDVLIQSWVGERRSARMDYFWGTYSMNYCTGFQFITEDLWIATEKGRTHPRDTIPTHFIRVGHVRLNKQIVVDLKDSLGNQYWTPNNISLIRSLSHSSPISGPFSADPASRLFGIKYDYRDFDGSIKSNCSLFGRATVEAWLGIGGPPDHMHWLMMPFPSVKSMHIDLTNREGLYLVGRRLVWATIWEHGWSLNVIDYNPGAGNAIPTNVELRGEKWKSWTGLWCSDPYPVALSSTTRIGNITRVVPTEDGILLKVSFVQIRSVTLILCQTNDPDANYTMLLM